MLFQGRRKISYPLEQEQLTDFGKVAELVNGTISTHMANKREIDYLTSYWKGYQPILGKTKPIRSEINNVILLNHAQRITRTITGYFLGTPIQFIQATEAVKDGVDELNKILSYEDKSSTDKEIGENQSVCGTAFRLIYTDGVFGDEVPFEEKSLDPSLTYLVYENTIAEKPLAGVHYYVKYNNMAQPIGRVYYVYTLYGIYTFETKGDGLATMETPYEFVPYNVGGIPVIEYPNNQNRIGDWELYMSVMDTINGLQSGRMDDIDQLIQSLLVFTNVEIDTDTFDEMREKGVILLKNMTNFQSKIDSINNPLDQTAMNLFAKELENVLDTLVGIPSRDNRAGGGGDTGQAVELRDGWADLEIVARNKEAVFKKSEKMALRIILYILKVNGLVNLNLKDVDIKFSRNKNHNLLVKTQSYQTLIQTQTLTPADALSIVDLVSDVNEFASRGEEYWTQKKEENMQEQLALQESQAKIKSENEQKPSPEKKVEEN